MSPSGMSTSRCSSCVSEMQTMIGSRIMRILYVHCAKLHGVSTTMLPDIVLKLLHAGWEFRDQGLIETGVTDDELDAGEAFRAHSHFLILVQHVIKRE